MCLPSARIRCVPSRLYTRSEPARSTRWSFEVTMRSESTGRASIITVKIECERDDAWFIGVSLVTRFMLPRKSRLSASSSEIASYTL